MQIVLIFENTQHIGSLEQFYWMIKKSKSLSNYGNYLDRKNSLKPDPQLYRKNMERTRENPMTIQKKSPKFIEGFDRITSRQKNNPFQIFNTRDKNNQTNYQVKDQLVTTRNAFYSVRRQSQPRLNKLVPSKQMYEKGTQVCQKLQSIERDQNIMTIRDLQTTRKSFHNMDFNKQIHRSHSYIKNPQGRQTLYPEEELLIKTVGGLDVSVRDSLNKLKNVHSFDSYTKRDFLSENKLKKKGAPPNSGAQAYKVAQEKFKGSWKVISPVKFNTIPSKNLSRYDRDCDAWVTKLQYQTRDELVKKKTPVLSMSKQIDRQINEVRSKYPFRIAI